MTLTYHRRHLTMELTEMLSLRRSSSATPFLLLHAVIIIPNFVGQNLPYDSGKAPVCAFTAELTSNELPG